MPHGYGGGGPFAWLWCFLWIDLLSRIYRPWVSFIALSFVALMMLIAILVLAAASNTEQNSPTTDPTSNMTLSHTHTYSYDAWWVNVIFLAVFAVIFVIPVVNYEPDYREYDRPPYQEDAKKSDRVATGPDVAAGGGREPQRPLLPIPVSDV
jgi:H+/Cl- antiporter ClcA